MRETGTLSPEAKSIASMAEHISLISIFIDSYSLIILRISSVSPPTNSTRISSSPLLILR